METLANAHQLYLDFPHCHAWKETFAIEYYYAAAHTPYHGVDVEEWWEELTYQQLRLSGNWELYWESLYYKRLAPSWDHTNKLLPRDELGRIHENRLGRHICFLLLDKFVGDKGDKIPLPSIALMKRYCSFNDHIKRKRVQKINRFLARRCYCLATTINQELLGKS